MSMSQPRPFNAASNKLAYAQAFARPATHRHARSTGRIQLLTRRRALRGNHKP